MKNSKSINKFQWFILYLLLFSGGENFEAHSQTDSLLKVIQNMKDDTNKVNAINELVWKIRISDYRKADSIGMVAYGIAKRINYYKGLAYSTKNIGAVYYYQSDYDKAIAFYEESFFYFKKINDKKGISIAYRNLACTFKQGGDWKQALDYFFKSLVLREEIGDSIGIASIYNEIGLVYDVSDLEGKDVAIDYYKKALRMQRKLGDETGMATSNLRIGIIWSNMYQENKEEDIADTAINYLLKAKEISVKINEINYIATIDESIGRIFLTRKKYKESFLCLTNSLKLRKDLGHKFGIANSMESIGSFYFSLKEYKKAEKYFLGAYKMAVEIGSKNLEKYNSLFLAECYSMQNNFKESSRYYKKHLEIKDSLMNEEKTKEMTRLSMQYEFDKKQKAAEIEIIKDETLYLEKVKKQKTITYFISILFLLVILLTILIFRSYKNRLKAKEKDKRIGEVFNAIEEERKRITIDLHDGVGQMLSTVKMYVSDFEDKIVQENEHSKFLYNESIKLLDESVTELQNTLYNIVPSSLIKYGLKFAIDEIISRISAGCKIHFNFDSVGFDNRQNEIIETAIYRIIQEALNNILKHSKATSTHIKLIKESDRVKLFIQDNGIGIDDFVLSQKKGLGLKGMLFRVQMLNGKMSVNSGSGQGTKMDIVIPV